MAKQITTGTRVYYRGDMANIDGLGTVTEYEQTRWGDQVTITMDDSRIIRIPAMMIKDKDTGNGMTRFCTMEAYEAYRAEKLAWMQEDMRQRGLSN